MRGKPPRQPFKMQNCRKVIKVAKKKWLNQVGGADADTLGLGGDLGRSSGLTDSEADGDME